MADLSENFQRLALRAHQWLYETTDGRVGQKIGKLPTLLLRTTGARTGQTRVSRARVRARRRRSLRGGGVERRRGSFAGLAAQRAGRAQGRGADRARPARPATAEILTEGPDYDRCWKIVNEVNRYKDGGRYDHYQTLTTRRIPLVVLST